MAIVQVKTIECKGIDLLFPLNKSALCTIKEGELIEVNTDTIETSKPIYVKEGHAVPREVLKWPKFLNKKEKVNFLEEKTTHKLFLNRTVSGDEFFTKEKMISAE